MIDLILLLILSYALYRMAVSFNITPWKWIGRYVVTFVVTFIASLFACVAIMTNIYGEAMMKDTVFMQKLGLAIEPFMMLYQILLFFFFRTRIVRYVHNLDLLDKNDNNDIPHTPAPKKGPKDPKDQKDFSYFR